MSTPMYDVFAAETQRIAALRATRRVDPGDHALRGGFLVIRSSR